jgi:hypothetical protein
MKLPLRILFVGNFRFNCGSSHALAGYVRAAKGTDCEVRASSLGLVDAEVRRRVPVADGEWSPDLCVVVCESERFLTEDKCAALECMAPRRRRIVLDPDGKCGPTVTIGTDTNHRGSEEASYWSGLYARLSDIVLQPNLNENSPGRFLYFGVDRNRPPILKGSVAKRFDLIYVGNNWYRWHDFVKLFEQLRPARDRFGEIGIFGQHWAADVEPGHEEYTYSDPEYLKQRGVQTFPPTPFDQVELTMSTGRCHPVFVRPVLHRLGLATPRMFETFMADTVPVLGSYLRDAEHLYGSDARLLQLPEQPVSFLLSILDSYDTYLELTMDIRQRLIRQHSYEERLRQLLEIGMQ